MQFTVINAADVNTDSMNNTVKKLQYMGMITSEMVNKQGSTITRGEFAKYLLIYLGKDETVPMASNVYFYDVPLSHAYASSINYILDLGYVKKDVSGMYLPDDKMTVKDAAMSLLRVMGYGSFLDSNATSSAVSQSYSELIAGVDSMNNNITVGGLIKMFENALDIPMYAMSEKLVSGSVSFTNENTFIEEYFEIFEVRGRVNATRLTSLYEDLVVNDDEVAIGSDIYAVPENMSNIIDYLGYQLNIYYKENDEGVEEIVYFENYKTTEIVIKASEIVDFSERQITYLKNDEAKARKESFEAGAYIIYNGQLLTNYTADIFNIKNGSIELVGINDKFDIVKIYDYTDIIIGGVSASEEIIYSKYTNEVFRLEDYDEAIVRDRYGRAMSLAELQPEMVVSVGVSNDGELIIFNVSGEIVTGVLDKIDTDNDETVWTIDGKDYIFSGGFEFSGRPLKAKVTVYLNYLDRICYVISGKSDNWLYGYLIKANMSDAGDSMDIKIYSESGKIEDLKADEKLKIDGEKGFGENGIKMLSYETPNSLNPSGTVQPQLIKYKVSSDGIISRIDTARVESAEDSKSSLAKNISNESRRYMNETKRLCGNGNDIAKFKLDCLVTGDTKVFVVPGDINDAKTRYDSYSMASPSYFVHERGYYIDAYDVDYFNGGAAGVIVVRLESLVQAPENLGLDFFLVTGTSEAIDNDDQVVKTVTGYSKSSNSMVTVTDYSELKLLEKNGVEPGDIIRYGYVNGNLTGLEIDMKMDTQLYNGYTIAPRYASNWHYDHVTAGYRIIVGQVVDISGNYMYYSLSATSESKMENCPLIYDMNGARIFVFNKSAGRNKLEEIDSARLREYTCGNNPNAKVVVHTRFGMLQTVVVYI